MQTVRHTIFGVGDVVKKEVKENNIHITVMFENGKESRFSIPESFTVGMLTAEGDLIEEVEAAINEKKMREQENLRRISAAPETFRLTTCGYGKKHPKPVDVNGSMEAAYEQYLVQAGYETKTPSGAPSTVYSYIGAIARHVLEEEHITWEMLRDDIDTIIAKYDVGGTKEQIGAKSNKTVINALKRFQELVNP